MRKLIIYSLSSIINNVNIINNINIFHYIKFSQIIAGAFNYPQVF